MARYMEYSTRIYQVYLRYIAPEDMHVYSIDEVFMDREPITCPTSGRTARELAAEMILACAAGRPAITATAGVGHESVPLPR